MTERHEAKSYIRGARPMLHRAAAALSLALPVFIGAVRAFPTAVMRGGALVHFHDSGDKRMPDDIAAGKGAKRDVLNVVNALDAFRPESPRGRSSWVMSPVITILELKPRTGEEHLHLLGGRVLSFVQDNEAVVEGAAAHERQRRILSITPPSMSSRARSMSVMSKRAS